MTSPFNTPAADVVSHEIQSIPAVSYETGSLRDKPHPDRQTPTESVRAVDVLRELEWIPDETLDAGAWRGVGKCPCCDVYQTEAAGHHADGCRLAAALAASPPAPDTAEVVALRAEVERLKLAIFGGEDAPGYAAVQSVETAEMVAAENAKSWFEANDRESDANIRATAAEERADKLAEALRPFGDLEMPGQEPDHWPAFGKRVGEGWPTVGDFRRARAALTQHDQARKTGEADIRQDADNE